MSITRFANQGMALPFSAAVGTDQLLFVSGQMAFRDGQLLAGSIAEQTRQTLENLKAVLAQAGLGLNAVIKVNIWLTHVEDFAAFNQVYNEYFAETLPARSTVRADLMVPAARVEIDAIAVR